jgi:hypothetical protein
MSAIGAACVISFRSGLLAANRIYAAKTLPAGADGVSTAELRILHGAQVVYLILRARVDTNSCAMSF